MLEVWSYQKYFGFRMISEGIRVYFRQLLGANALLDFVLAFSYSKNFKFDYCLRGFYLSNCPKFIKICYFLLIMYAYSAFRECALGIEVILEVKFIFNPLKDNKTTSNRNYSKFTWNICIFFLHLTKH